MKTLVVNRNLIVSIFAVMLLVYGSQGVSYGQGDAPTVTPAETNTCLVVGFVITLDEGVDENAYQVQLRQKSPQGEWITKCVVIKRGSIYEIAGDADISASAKWIPGSYHLFFWTDGYYSEKTFHVKAIFTNLDPGTTYEVRYRDTNVSECTENPPDPDPWSSIGEGTTHLITLPPTFSLGENNTSLMVSFSDRCWTREQKAYQVQLRQKSPQGEWVTICTSMDATISSIRTTFTDLDPGTTYEARYRDTNVSECTENPPNPDPWSSIGEGTTKLVSLPRVEFVDANLARIVRRKLRLFTGGLHIDLLKIPRESLSKLMELDASDSKITHLTGLEHATQLTELDISDNQISDISPLAQLTQLTELDISDNQISDITPLTQLTQLTELDFGSNPITDISPARSIFPTVVVIEPDIETEKRLSIFWEDGFQIRRMDFANPRVQDIITEGTSDVEDIALDITNRKIYWANSRDIKRANLDGTGVEDVITGLYYTGLALDVSAGKIYWGDDDLSSNIKRANLDGTDAENVVKIERWFSNITLDAVGGKIYWTTYYDGGIWGANLDGNHAEEVVNVGGWPTDIALDVVGGKMYWIDDLKDKIRRANLDGTDVEDVVTNLFIDGLALDVSAGKIYFTKWGRIGRRNGGKIQRANLDGTDVEDVVTGLHHPTVLVLNTLNTKDTKVSITPASGASPAIGEQITFNLNITGSKAVAGYQATVRFDDTALRYVSAANGDFLPAGASFVPPVVEGNLVKLNAASLAGETGGDGTLATLTFEVVAAKASALRLSDVLLTNSAGETSVPHLENAEISEPTVLKEDVNGDDIVDIQDLVLVASNLGKTGQNAADVNGDGVVNIADLILVAGALGTSAAAPSLYPQALEMLTATEVKQWLSAAQQLDLTDITSQRGILFLQQLLVTLTPKKTALLPNYPNPFNPETWIPYHLAKEAEVALHIYAVNGTLVRTLILEHQAAGMYQSRSRAAYWDGKNEFGEPVASGVYFYTLTAGGFTATRKMLILK